MVGPSGWDHQRALLLESQQWGLNWSIALTWAPQPTPPQGSVTLYPHPGFCPFSGRPGLWPQLLGQEEENAWPTPTSDRVLAPEELGVLPARVRGSWLGINSAAGGGDRDFHSQTLEASRPGRAGLLSTRPLLALHHSCPLGVLITLQPQPASHTPASPLGGSCLCPLGEGRPLGSGPQ